MRSKLATSNKNYIILIIILTVLAIGGSILIHQFVYIAGTRNNPQYGIFYGFGLFLILFPLLAFIALGSSIAALINLILQHRNVSQILFKIALILLGPVIVCSAFFYTIPLSPVFLKGFEQWILQEADIDAIQTWLAIEGSKHAGQYYTSEKGYPEELPDYLVKLNPKYISFSGPKVEIIWFHFMDNYGLIICSPEMETPEKGCIKIDDSLYEFRRPVKQGAYVFSRG